MVGDGEDVSVGGDQAAEVNGFSWRRRRRVTVMSSDLINKASDHQIAAQTYLDPQRRGFSSATERYQPLVLREGTSLEVT